MTTETEQSLEEVWKEILAAGGHARWIEARLEAAGLAVERHESTDSLSKRDLAEYKRQLKAEAAERKRLNRLGWDAYRATHIVYLGDGIYWNDDDDFDKFDHPRVEERRKENLLPELNTPDDLAKALGITLPELRWLTYHRDAAEFLHYTPFTIPKKSGGERQIWAPMPKLKAAQSWIREAIVEHLPVHGAAHGFLPGRSILTNARQHTNSRVLVNLDVKDFFPTITLRRVKGLFRSAGYREQVALLLALLCTEAPRRVVEYDGTTFYLALGERCLPQGAPTSPGITNAICLALDRRLTGLAQKHGWRYTRYADDITFSFPAGKKGAAEVSTILGTTRAVLESEGFEMHPDKTRVCRKGARQKVTGLIVNGDGPPRIPRHKRRMLRAAVHNLKAGKPLPEDESVHSLRGWAAYLYMTNQEAGAQYLQDLAAFE